jgi:hypothetical protein
MTNPFENRSMPLAVIKYVKMEELSVNHVVYIEPQKASSHRAKD